MIAMISGVPGSNMAVVNIPPIELQLITTLGDDYRVSRAVWGEEQSFDSPSVHELM